MGKVVFGEGLSKAKVPAGKANTSAVDWKAIKNEWFGRNAAGDHYTLKQLAADHGLNVDVVRRHASAKYNDGRTWQKELKQYRAELADGAAAEMRKRFEVDELEVRVRQHRIGRGMQAKAVEKFNSTNGEELTVYEAVRMYQVGAVQERRALGMPDTVEVVEPGGDDDIVEDRLIRLAKHRAMKKFADRFTEWLEERRGDDGD